VLKGGVDSEYRLEKDDQGVVRVESLKMKDAPTPDPMAFRVSPVELGFLDEDGEQVTSAVLTDTEYRPPAAPRSGGGGKWQTRAVKVLDGLYQEHRATLEASGFDPDNAKVLFSDWREGCYKAGMIKSSFYNVKNALEQSGKVSIKDGYVFPEE
jgi:hypothetical protein